MPVNFSRCGFGESDQSDESSSTSQCPDRTSSVNRQFVQAEIPWHLTQQTGNPPIRVIKAGWVTNAECADEPAHWVSRCRSPQVATHPERFHNKLTALPKGISDKGLVHLSEIIANNNAITALPADLSNLPHLNVLDLADNQIEELPNELSECTKLRDLRLSGNKIKDRKLVKFTQQNSLKQIMQFLAAALQKSTAAAAGDKKDKKAKPKKKKKTDKDADVDEVAKAIMTVLRFPASRGLVVKVESKVASVRPYIVCCILHHLDFYQSNNMFKNFITKQVGFCLHGCMQYSVSVYCGNITIIQHPL